LDQFHQTLEVGNFGAGTQRNYLMEVRLLFHYYHQKTVEEITDQDINQYILFIKQVHCVGRAKCRSAAQSFSFFFKHIIKKPFVLPSKLYPRKEFVLPAVMAQTQVKHLYLALTEPRQRAVISILYGTGMRIGEVTKLKMSDIERANNRILVRQGKGAKDRYVMLGAQVLLDIETYYRAYRPKGWLFESKQYPGRSLHNRSMQTIVNAAMVTAGFPSGQYTAHTLRHSFATHMLDNGCDIHTIKTLLGHAKIETTMIYLHLTLQRRNSLVSPLDAMLQKEETPKVEGNE
jgi:site-specific recombinase XerD